MGASPELRHVAGVEGRCVDATQRANWLIAIYQRASREMVSPLDRGRLSQVPALPDLRQSLAPPVPSICAARPPSSATDPHDRAFHQVPTCRSSEDLRMN